MRQPRSRCLAAIHRAKKEFGNTDIYDVYEEKCRYDSKCAACPRGRSQVSRGLWYLPVESVSSDEPRGISRLFNQHSKAACCTACRRLARGVRARVLGSHAHKCLDAGLTSWEACGSGRGTCKGPQSGTRQP